MNYPNNFNILYFPYKLGDYPLKANTNYIIKEAPKDKPPVPQT